jgi:hypothetical protein
VPSNRNILIFAGTGVGKTTQLGELALYDYAETGKKTKLYTADKGGLAPIQGHIEAGLIKPVELSGLNPWTFEYAVQGLIPKDGKWVKDEDPEIGHYAFESLTSWGWAQMLDLSTKAAGKNGRVENIGGDAPIRFNAGDGIWIGSNNRTHFGIVQNNIRDLVFKSFLLPGTVTWTSLDLRGEDKESGSPIIAPVIVGKSGADQIPSWFHYTFHLTADPAEGNGKPKHRLHFVHHKDMTTGGMAFGIANSRVPLGFELPSSLEPASVPEALKRLKDATKGSAEAIRGKMAELDKKRLVP